MVSRAIWKGVVRLEGEDVPVKLYSGVEDRSIHFRLLHQEDRVPVEQEMVTADTGEPVEYSEAIRAYPTEEGEFVILHPDELEALEPEDSRDIEVERFIPSDALDHPWYDRPYYLGPDGDVEAYFALAEALRRSGRTGIVEWVMRKRRYRGAIRPEMGYLMLFTLHSEDEIVSVEALEAPAGRDLSKNELKMARQLVDAMTEPFDAEDYENEHRARVMELIEAKEAGEVVEFRKPRERKKEEDLSAALEASLKSARPSLRMVDEDGTPLERRYSCPKHERELAPDEIVRGYEVEKGRFVLVREDELEALEPEKSREIDLQRFVDRSELDPVLFNRAYFLTPSTEATKPYRLLARVMEESGRAGIATFVMRGREHLVAILADRGILRAETMRFNDEIRSAEDVGLPGAAEPPEDHVKAILDAVEKRSADALDPDEIRDVWADRLRALVKKKRKKHEDVVELPEEERESARGARVIDIMEVLKRNLQGRDEEGGGSASGGTAGPPILAKNTKQELYDRAKALEIPGRSKMSKDELVEAIRRAS